jgi:hypothetical protein
MYLEIACLLCKICFLKWKRLSYIGFIIIIIVLYFIILIYIVLYYSIVL